MDPRWLIGVLIAAGLGGCRDREADRPQAAQREGAPTRRVEDIQGSPLRYLGREVTVIGQVDKVLDERVFEIEGDGVIWPKQLLVVARAPVRFGPTQLEDGQELVVRGTVSRISPGNAGKVGIERELAHAIDGELARRYRDQAVLVADSVRLIETQARWSKPFQQGAIVSAIRLLSAIDPTTFAGQAVDLANVPVRATTGRGLWVGFGPRSELFLAALHDTELVGIEPGDHISVRGAVRMLPRGPEAVSLPQIEPARARGEKVYIEASAVTKLTPRPSS